MVELANVKFETTRILSISLWIARLPGLLDVRVRRRDVIYIKFFVEDSVLVTTRVQSVEVFAVEEFTVQCVSVFSKNLGDKVGGEIAGLLDVVSLVCVGRKLLVAGVRGVVFVGIANTKNVFLGFWRGRVVDTERGCVVVVLVVVGTKSVCWSLGKVWNEDIERDCVLGAADTKNAGRGLRKVGDVNIERGCVVVVIGQGY